MRRLFEDLFDWFFDSWVFNAISFILVSLFVLCLPFLAGAVTATPVTFYFGYVAEIDAKDFEPYDWVIVGSFFAIGFWAGIRHIWWEIFIEFLPGGSDEDARLARSFLAKFELPRSLQTFLIGVAASIVGAVLYAVALKQFFES